MKVPYRFKKAFKKILYGDNWCEADERLVRQRHIPYVRNAYKDSWEARQARPIFEALCLREKDVTKFYNIFRKACVQVGTGLDDRISYGDFLSYLDIDHSKFHLRLFRNYDNGKLNQVDFKTFVVQTWTYCTHSWGSLVTLLFDMYDTHGAGILYEDDMKELIKDIWGPEYKKVPQAVTVLAGMDRLCVKTIGGYGISLDIFSDYLRKNPGLLMPTLAIQERMREKIMGKSFWSNASKFRILKASTLKKQGLTTKSYLDVDLLLEAYSNMSLAEQISEDPDICKNKRVTGIMKATGPKMKRHELHMRAVRELRVANQWRLFSRALLALPPKFGGKGGRSIQIAPNQRKYAHFKNKHLLAGEEKRKLENAIELWQHELDDEPSTTLTLEDHFRAPALPSSPFQKQRSQTPLFQGQQSSTLPEVRLDMHSSSELKDYNGTENRPRSVKKESAGEQQGLALSPLRGAKSASPDMASTQRKVYVNEERPRTSAGLRPKSSRLELARVATAKGALQPYLGQPSAWSKPPTTSEEGTTSMKMSRTTGPAGLKSFEHQVSLKMPRTAGTAGLKSVHDQVLVKMSKTVGPAALKTADAKGFQGSSMSSLKHLETAQRPYTAAPILS